MITTQPIVSARIAPFAHTLSGEVFSTSMTNAVLNWFETTAPWCLRIESFYEQYELNLHQVEMPTELAPLIDDAVIKLLTERFLSPITDDAIVLVEANAHKLLPGQTIKIHNDFIGDDETHRILIQINRSWTEQDGGLLMLFSSPIAEDIARIIRPLNGSGMGFEISPASFHAVSTIHSGERYTLVYSFKRAA